MADLKKRLKSNMSGNFFVDSTCINCDTCRQLAPETFEEVDEYSSVYAQPETDEEIRKATRALIACPTGSIGTIHENIAKEVMKDFPLTIEEDVSYLGFNSPESYGSNSYFIKHKEGNWLIDSPKYNLFLIKQIEKLGGIKYIFLTHSDDVADASQFAEHFKSKRIIHEDELKAEPNAEIILKGESITNFENEFIFIPTPGHTKGHTVLLYKNKFLFTGDHLRWNRSKKCLHASKQTCWYNWDQQITSLEKLVDFKFEWVLPGHGQNIKLPELVMQKELKDLIERMKNFT